MVGIGLITPHPPHSVSTEAPLNCLVPSPIITTHPQASAAWSRKEHQELLRHVMSWGLPMRLNEILQVATHAHSHAAAAAAAGTACVDGLEPSPSRSQQQLRAVRDKVGEEYLARLRRRCPGLSHKSDDSLVGALLELLGDMDSLYKTALAGTRVQVWTCGVRAMWHCGWTY